MNVIWLENVRLIRVLPIPFDGFSTLEADGGTGQLSFGSRYQ